MTATRIGLTLVDELARQGITDVVISPGSRNAPLALAVAARPEDFRVHVRIDERTAAFLALGLARGSQRPVVVLCSSGTATANYHPAVIEADAAGVPLVVLTADRPAELRGTGANQTIDQVGLYGSAARLFTEVQATSPDQIREYVQVAVAEASAAWPGPVHLNVPLPEPLLEPATDAANVVEASGTPDPVTTQGYIADQRGDNGPASVVEASGTPDAVTTQRVATVPDPAPLLAGRRVMVVAGEGADLGGSAAMTLTAIRRLAVPLLAEPTSGLRAGPNVIRAGHWLASTPEFLDHHQPEVVILLGRPVLSRAINALVEGADTVVMCDSLSRGWDPGRNVTDVVDSSLHDWTRDLGDEALPDAGLLRGWQEADVTACAEVDAVLDASPISEIAVARSVAAAVPDGGQLVVASSLVIRHLNEVMHPREGIRVLGNRGASGIDGFTSTAIGAALAHDAPTVALAGDLSVLHDLTGLVIGPGEPVPTLPIVVINNDGGGIFDLLPYGTRVAPDHFRRLFTTPHGVPLEGVAMTLGHGHTGVDTIAELPQVLEDAQATPGITLIEVTTDTATETARYHQIVAAVRGARLS